MGLSVAGKLVEDRENVGVALVDVVEGKVVEGTEGVDMSAASRKLDSVSLIGVSCVRKAGGDRERVGDTGCRSGCGEVGGVTAGEAFVVTGSTGSSSGSSSKRDPTWPECIIPSTCPAMCSSSSDGSINKSQV